MNCNFYLLWSIFEIIIFTIVLRLPWVLFNCFIIYPLFVQGILRPILQEFLNFWNSETSILHWHASFLLFSKSSDLDFLFFWQLKAVPWSDKLFKSWYLWMNHLNPSILSVTTMGNLLSFNYQFFCYTKYRWRLRACGPFVIKRWHLI